MSEEGLPEGIRLAKRVAALQGCSRREAEILIASGAVQVAGQTVTEPARRVLPEAPLQVAERVVTRAVTVLLHKPAGAVSAQALRPAWAGLFSQTAPSASLREWLPLPAQASGLSVWSDEAPITRRLEDRQRPLETEWLVTLPMTAAAELLPRWRAAGVRASLGHEREGLGQWRLVLQAAMGWSWADFLDQSQFAAGLPAGWRLHRQRIGRLGLSPLPPGQARLRLEFEKF